MTISLQVQVNEITSFCAQEGTGEWGENRNGVVTGLGLIGVYQVYGGEGVLCEVEQSDTTVQAGPKIRLELWERPGAEFPNQTRDTGCGWPCKAS